MGKPLSLRIRHRLKTMRLHPIRVFVFHQVSESFEPETMWECDWTQIEDFKRNILELRKKYTFISLTKATERLRKDRVRLKDYAVLTADDGWASLKNILPWLAGQKIPITLFLNPSCLDGKHWHSRETDLLLNSNDVNKLVNQHHQLITIASHGWTHKDCTTMSTEEFIDSVNESDEVLKGYMNTIPYFAFASGRHTAEQVAYLKQQSIIPVFVDGMKNDSDPTVIHRECIDGKSL